MAADIFPLCATPLTPHKCTYFFHLHLPSGHPLPPSPAKSTWYGHFSLGLPFLPIISPKFRRNLSSPAAVMLPGNSVVSDICAAVLSGGIALSLLRVFEETAKRGLFDQVNTEIRLSLPTI